MKTHRPQHEKQNKQKKLWRGLLLAGVVLTAAALVTGLTMAKYVQQWKSEPSLADAKAFYFTSDLLKDPSENASYKLYSWGGGITIQLQNFEDEKRVSETDITYEVSYTLTGGTKTEVTNGTIASSSGTTMSDTITVKPDAGAKTVTVIAKATAPYQKTLTATFKLQDTESPKYQVVDFVGSPTAELIIKGGNTTKDLTLNWDASLLSPDRTNPLFKGAAFSGSSVSIKITASGSCSILLFKKEPTQNYSIKEKDITDSTISLNGN